MPADFVKGEFAEEVKRESFSPLHLSGRQTLWSIAGEEEFEFNTVLDVPGLSDIVAGENQLNLDLAIRASLLVKSKANTEIRFLYEVVCERTYDSQLCY